MLAFRRGTPDRAPARGESVPPRSAGVWLVAASLGFWLAWLLMPGVGITDTDQIFALVGARRESVYLSVWLQLLSAAAYAPGLAGILASEWGRQSRAVRLGCVLLLVGAMGSAADAILHLVAYEMTAPGAPAEAMAPVMRRLQGPDLVLLLPFVAALFGGHAVLVSALRRRSAVTRFGFWCLLATPAIALAGAAGARAGALSPRAVGLAALGALAASLAAVGASLCARSRGADAPYSGSP
jgi:hypothetical protein